MKQVLFVCLGNICRSPLAQGVLEKALADASAPLGLGADSAATHAYHTGASPDSRAIEAAARRGIDISRQRARAVSDNDFSAFDAILAMDTSNLADLISRCPEHHSHKIVLFSTLIPGLEGAAVPDPYYGDESGFDGVLDLLEQGMPALLQKFAVI